METTMKAPDCREHGAQVLDLALGLLEDGDAADAEAVLASCPVCAEWWNLHLAGEATTAIGQAVAAAIGDFTVPRSRRMSAWMAAAAAAVTIAFGCALVWYAISSPPSPASPAHVVRGLFDGIQAPAHDLNNDGAVDASDVVTALGSVD
jgi:hypothetical protein